MNSDNLICGVIVSDAFGHQRSKKEVTFTARDMAEFERLLNLAVENARAYARKHFAAEEEGR